MIEQLTGSVVLGHTDNKGTLDYNLNLSNRRATAVVQALTSKYGIGAARMVPRGLGPMTPMATNRTEEGRAKNRRVELVESQASEGASAYHLRTHSVPQLKELQAAGQPRDSVVLGESSDGP